MEYFNGKILTGIFRCLLFLFLSNMILSQNSLVFKNISIDDGLSQYSVLDILQDKDGFMWFGTQDGLDRYDGYNFKHFRFNKDDSNSISSNNISSLLEDKDGNIWIGTSNGLNLYNPELDQFKRFFTNEKNDNFISHNDISAIFEDSFGNIWIGTNGGGLNKIVRTNNGFIITRFVFDQGKNNSLSSNLVTALTMDKFGSLWVGTSNGLNRFNEETNSFDKYYNEADNQNSLINNEVSVLITDHLGDLWIGTRTSGISKLSISDSNYTKLNFQNFKSEQNKESLSYNWIETLFEDSRHNIWAGTLTQGLDKISRTKNKEKFSFQNFRSNPINPKSISNNTIKSILEDRDGMLWIGTRMGGVNILSLEGKKISTYKSEFGNENSLNNSIVISFFEDKKGNIWIGTIGGGLNKLDKKTKKITRHFQQGEKNYFGIARSICQDKYNNLWISTNGDGIVKIENMFRNSKNLKITNYRNIPGNSNSLIGNTVDVLYTSPSDSNIVWMGTSNGLSKLNVNKNTFTHFYAGKKFESINDNNIRSLFEDENGILWVGTRNGGVNKFDTKKNTFEYFTTGKKDVPGINNNYIRYIHKDKKGNLWLGTDGGGLNKIENIDALNNYKYKTYTTKDGLPNNVVYSILEDESGNLWMSTNRGISKFNPELEKFTNFNKDDGLQDDEYNHGAQLKSRDGKFYFGGIGGFDTFYPDSIKVIQKLNKPVLTDFQLFFESIKVGKYYDEKIILDKSIFNEDFIELTYEENSILIKYSSLDYKNPEKVKYAYFLEGSDNDWNYVDERNFAIYTHLNPGEYNFKVKASFDNFNWTEIQSCLIVIIYPPFWQTWWFRTFAVISIISLIVLLYVFRVNRIKKHSIKLEQSNIKLNNEIKKRISSEREREKLNNTLETKNLELEQIVYVSSHDLRSPLVNIQGFSKELKFSIEELISAINKLEISDEEKKEILEICNEQIKDSYTFIDSNVLKMERLISGLLMYSRINRQSLSLKKINMNNLLNNLVEDFYSDKNISENLEVIYKNLPECSGDLKMISEVFYQLIDNAVKFKSAKKKCIVEISGESSGDDIKYFIQDNGEGINKNHLIKIFDIFHRLYPEKYSGDGVGLALVKAIVLKHNGNIDVNSEEKHGTRFTITLPK